MLQIFGGQWDPFLALAEFEYNNSYHSSIQMTLFDELHGKRFYFPVGQFDTFEVRLWGTGLLHDSMDSVYVIQEWLRSSQSMQKRYIDKKIVALRIHGW